jgi:protein-L-isoaspartate(D-aspartate) O-methyltransferase
MWGSLGSLSQEARTPFGGSASGSRPERSAEWQAAVEEKREARAKMVATQIERRGVSDPRVLEALRRVPRHRFVPLSVRSSAHHDGPLPIAGEQSISQPYIVAAMTEAARIAPSDRCLEIGTGSGYQAAVLAELCRETYSIEYLPEVAALGRRNLQALGYLERGVQLRVGDGYEGWPEQAPFDVILVTAAPAHVPPPLLHQLGLGGRLVIPVGPERDQNLELWIRRGPGQEPAAFSRVTQFGVRFVPFLGPHG